MIIEILLIEEKIKNLKKKQSVECKMQEVVISYHIRLVLTIFVYQNVNKAPPVVGWTNCSSGNTMFLLQSRMDLN